MNIQERIEEILPEINKLKQSSYSENFPENCKEEIVAEVGKKYARLVAFNPATKGRSAFGFVDLTSGDILKAAGWSAPAKDARGNVFDSDFLNAFTPYGVVYKRGGI